jgi:hypothetical protein
VHRRQFVAFTAVVVLGTGLVAAPAADASAPPFRSAGYALTGAQQVNATFVMPTVTCGAADRSLSIGLFAASGAWHATASVYCYQGQPEADLEVGDRHGGQVEGGLGLAKPGHLIEVTASRLGSNTPMLTVEDLYAKGSETLVADLTAPSTAAVGAFADPVAPFTPITVHAHVDSGQPFTSVPHPRHNEDRSGATLIKTGGPSPTGTHFTLYFRHH